MGSWLNNDGLYIEYGPTEVTVVDGGELSVLGGLHEVEIDIPLASLAVTTPLILSDTIELPAGARIHKVTFIVETAAGSSGSGEIDFGLIRTDRTTELDYNGLVAALETAEMSDPGAIIEFMNGSDSTPAGETGDGALVGTTLAFTGLLTANAVTAVFQSGLIKARVYWYRP